MSSQDKNEFSSVLRDYFESALKDHQEYHIDRSFDINLLSFKGADKAINEINAQVFKDDAASKLKYRKITLCWLFVLLGVQIVFMNRILTLLFANQTVVCPFFRPLLEQELNILADLAKWYTTSVLAELLGAFIYILTVVFATPRFKK